MAYIDNKKLIILVQKYPQVCLKSAFIHFQSLDEWMKFSMCAVLMQKLIWMCLFFIVVAISFLDKDVQGTYKCSSCFPAMDGN